MPVVAGHIVFYYSNVCSEYLKVKFVFSKIIFCADNRFRLNEESRSRWARFKINQLT